MFSFLFKFKGCESLSVLRHSLLNQKRITSALLLCIFLLSFENKIVAVYSCSSRSASTTTLMTQKVTKATKVPPLICTPAQSNILSPVSSLTKDEWKQRYISAMLLGGAADAIGYYRGSWEFNKDGMSIHKELKDKGGIGALQVKKPEWIVSDDTVMHLATAEAIIEYAQQSATSLETLYPIIAKYYVNCMKDMDGRAAGITTIKSVDLLDPSKPDGYRISFNRKGGGCGGAMRSMCIGLYFPRPEDFGSLVAVSIEAGRMTHNHPTGYLGSLTSALFTSYAIQGKPIHTWGAGLMKTLDKAWEHIVETDRDVQENKDTWDYFKNKWSEYLKGRCLEKGDSQPRFPSKYGVAERDAFYKSISFDGWGGASGHDAPMIAYDALLGSGESWEELANRAFFHGGDSDSTAIISATWFAILYGTKGVPPGNYENLEYRDRLENAGEKIFELVKQHFN